MNKKPKVHSLTGRITLQVMIQAFKAVKRRFAVDQPIADEVFPLAPQAQ